MYGGGQRTGTWREASGNTRADCGRVLGSRPACCVLGRPRPQPRRRPRSTPVPGSTCERDGPTTALSLSPPAEHLLFMSQLWGTLHLGPRARSADKREQRRGHMHSLRVRQSLPVARGNGSPWNYLQVSSTKGPSWALVLLTSVRNLEHHTVPSTNGSLFGNSFQVLQHTEIHNKMNTNYERENPAVLLIKFNYDPFIL